MTTVALFYLLLLYEVRARIEERVEVQPNGCWKWLGSNDGRYGQIRLFGERFKTHVAAFYVYKGHVPKGRVLAHRCDHTRCCAPEHLNHKLQRFNIQEASDRNRLPNALGRKKVTLARRLAKKEGWTQERIAQHIQAHPSTVHRIITKKSWK